MLIVEDNVFQFRPKSYMLNRNAVELPWLI